MCGVLWYADDVVANGLFSECPRGRRSGAVGHHTMVVCVPWGAVRWLPVCEVSKATLQAPLAVLWARGSLARRLHQFSTVFTSLSGMTAALQG